MNTVGVVAALAAEARALGRSREYRAESASFGNLKFLSHGSLLAVSGIGAPAAAAAARTLIEAGVSALMTFGTAGGLDPRLNAGALLLPAEILLQGEAHLQRFATSAPWRERVRARLSLERSVEQGSVLSSALPLQRAADKAAMFRATGAVAVDMESAAVAQVAAEHRMPYLCVRAVVDTASDELPRAVAEASRAGRVRIARLLLSLALAPRDVGQVLKLAGRYRVALSALRAVARCAPLTQA